MLSLRKFAAIGLMFIALLCAAPETARASSISYTGNFTADDDLLVVEFSLAAPGDVTLLTYGYAGGTNAAGTVIDRGGFDPIVSLFFGSGPSAILIGINNDGGSLVGTDSVTGASWDSYLQLFSLPTGSYTAVLSQSDNNPSGAFLSDGFDRTGQGNFTGPQFLGSPGSFIDANPSQRTSAYALDIVSTSDISTVPEPSTFLLLGVGLGAGVMVRRWGRSNS